MHFDNPMAIIYYSGAAKLTYRAFYDKSMKFGTVIPWTIPIIFGRGGDLAHA